MSRRSSRFGSTPVTPRSSNRRKKDDDEMDDIDSEGDEPDLSGVDEDMDDDDNYNKLYEDNWTKSNKNQDEEESDDDIHENKQNNSVDVVNAKGEFEEDAEKTNGNKEDANDVSKEELFAKAVRETAFFNVRLQAERNSKSPFYFDPHTRTFQSIYSYRIRGPYDPESKISPPNGYRPHEASRLQRPTIEAYTAQIRQEKNKSGKYFTQLRQLLEQHQDYQLQAYQCYLDYQHAQQEHQKSVQHLSESLSRARDYEDAPEQIPLWIQSRTEEKNMKVAHQKLIQYQTLLQQLQPKITQAYSILFPGVNSTVNPNQLLAANVLPVSAREAKDGAGGITSMHLMQSNLRNQLHRMKSFPQRRKGERESSRLGKRGLDSDEASGEESSQPAKRRKIDVPSCADCDKQKNEEMLECSECGSFHHPSCLNLSKATLRKVHTYKWKCGNCKMCEKCNASGIEEKLLFCDYCDKAYHTYCLDPPLDNLPEGEWICGECMGEYTKNKEKLRILREKTAARRAAARAKKNAKRKSGGGGRSRRKKNSNKKKTESAEEKSEGEEEKSEDDENKEENSDNEGEDEENRSVSGTQESEAEEDPEETAQLALDLLSTAALGSYSTVSPTKGKSKEPSDDEAVELINPSEKEKEEKRPSMKVIVRRTFKK